MSSPLTKLPTGVPGLDNLLIGGIPRGRSTLIAGRSGTGKSVVSLQMAASLGRQGLTTIVMAVEESPEDLIHTGDSLGLDISGLVRDGRVVVVDVNRPADGPVIASGDYDIFGLVHRIEGLVATHAAKALVLDSATALFSPRPSEERMRQHFFHLISAFRRLDLTAVVIAEAQVDYGALTTLGVEDFL